MLEFAPSPFVLQVCVSRTVRPAVGSAVLGRKSGSRRLGATPSNVRLCDNRAYLRFRERPSIRCTRSVRSVSSAARLALGIPGSQGWGTIRWARTQGGEAWSLLVGASRRDALVGSLIWLALSGVS